MVKGSFIGANIRENTPTFYIEKGYGTIAVVISTKVSHRRWLWDIANCYLCTLFYKIKPLTKIVSGLIFNYLLTD